ncbi:UNVERIFIED_CONTAM: hypothetical protein K2H54_033431 [Gekko kuhli]
MFSRYWSKYSTPFSSPGKPSAEISGSSPPKHMKQGKAEARSSLIPETDNTLSQTNPLDVGLKSLRSSSHPQSSEFLQALERPIQIVNDLLGENQHLQKELNNSHFLRECLQAEVKQLQQELQKRQSGRGVSEHHLVAENQRLQQELQKRQSSRGLSEHHLVAENQRLQQELQKRQSSRGLSERHLVAENQRLQQELQELQELKNTQEALLAHLEAENQELQQELEELRKGLVPESETTAGEMPVPQIIAFPVQVQRSGETGGYEKQFLRDVAKLLNSHKVTLQVEEYQEGSEHLLLLFSSIASRAGTDIDNALNGLKSMQKVLLIVFNLKPKSNTRFFADLKPQVRHPALVGTVHACFSLQDGFYHCQINQDAVESVAATIMQLTQDG